MEFDKLREVIASVLSVEHITTVEEAVALIKSSMEMK